MGSRFSIWCWPKGWQRKMGARVNPMPLRICFFGDSFVNGTGDDSCLGWVGRVCAIARGRGRDVTCYNLGIRGNTTTDILGRWRREASDRLLPEHDGRLVFSFGANDCCADENGSVRVSNSQARANAETILDAALGWRPTLLVGPLPVGDPVADERIGQLSGDFARVCVRLGVPYLPVWQLAGASVVWAREVAAGDGAHPNAGGYTLVAEAVQRWPAWQDWVEGG